MDAWKVIYIEDDYEMFKIFQTWIRLIDTYKGSALTAFYLIYVKCEFLSISLQNAIQNVAAMDKTRNTRLI